MNELNRKKFYIKLIKSQQRYAFIDEIIFCVFNPAQTPSPAQASKIISLNNFICGMLLRNVIVFDIN